MPFAVVVCRVGGVCRCGQGVWTEAGRQAAMAAAVRVAVVGRAAPLCTRPRTALSKDGGCVVSGNDAQYRKKIAAKCGARMFCFGNSRFTIYVGGSR